MALTRERKQQVVAQYQEWFSRSQAVILMEYTGLTMKDLDALRAKVRESGGEFHVLKNTLARVALNAAGISLPEGYLEKSTAATFAFTDAVATTKALMDATKNLAVVKVKGGLLGTQVLSESQVKALAALPPLPVVRAQLLGVLQAPASKLVRTIAEPARGVAAVIRAYSEKAASAA